jgi:hypothetical protein
MKRVDGKNKRNFFVVPVVVECQDCKMVPAQGSVGDSHNWIAGIYVPCPNCGRHLIFRPFFEFNPN